MNYCVNCKHFEPRTEPVGCTRRKHPVGPVSGKQTVDLRSARCERSRRLFPWVDKCGPEGKYFERAPEQVGALR